ncbi:MAG TPA: Rne/Rng family ribonuclease [Xanthobacteraceae bacterium]|nr:Rne/Rng family ribonuclease [Xanthobacteraceae bacterium]
MANKMLIDATHPEETRVVVLRGNRVEEFDFESASRRQLRGNIYLAKVTRVEPSLQAAFVDYGGNRHGFLAFSEIHPDYYQIPVADRQALIDEEERAHRDAEAEADRRAGMRRQPPRHRAAERHTETVVSEPIDEDLVGADVPPIEASDARPDTPTHPDEGYEPESGGQRHDREPAEHTDSAANDDDVTRVDAGAHTNATAHTEQDRRETEANEFDNHTAIPEHDDAPVPGDATAGQEERDDAGDIAVTDLEATEQDHDDEANGQSESAEGDEEEIVESVGGDDAMEEVPDRAPRHRRQYKIQEVIKRRQIMLVQVVKEERGTKGAALTTYLSLAGRYSVLMPNTARGGGISRKITNVLDRRRLKDIAQELEVPEGMGVILRTAGAARTKTEIKRDFEYLLRAWETVRDLTLKSTAPTLVYEEGSLVKRSIRDLYNKDIDEVMVAGDEAFRDARDFMRMLMPSHAKNVRPYQDSQPILAKYAIESQLDAMFSPVVQLRSGGYIVLNQTEALVAIDVNSGRATREHHIEDTALKTNLEASEEIARQLRLRDLAGLIVIDFIDMDEKRNNRAVERRLKDCLKNDRARIQVGRISHFGLMEMSRQRIRTSVLESSTDKCPHCGGTGHVRSVSSVALQLLRMIEETLQRGATHNIVGRTRAEIALYVLNHKRAHLYDLEHRFQISVTIAADATISGQLPFVIEKGEQMHTLEQARALAARATSVPVAVEETGESDEPIDEVETEEDEDSEFADTAEPGEPVEANEERAENGEGGARRRRRRRRRGRRGEAREEGLSLEETFEGEGARAVSYTRSHDQPPSHPAAADDESGPASGNADPDLSDEDTEAGDTRADNGNGDSRRRRRRGRRGGRRARREEHDADISPPENGVAPIDEEVAHAVADFGGPPVEPALQQRSREPDLVAPDHSDGQPEAKPEPVPAMVSEPVAPLKPTAPRRRSTVREPAPFLAGSAAASPQPAPAIVTPVVEVETTAPPPSTSDPTAPRRAGWWAKRMLVDKS